MRSSAFSINFSGISKWTTLITIIIFLSKIIEVLGQNICSILFSLMNGYFLIYFLSHFYVIRTGPVFGVLENCSSDKGILVRRNSGCERSELSRERPIIERAILSPLSESVFLGARTSQVLRGCAHFRRATLPGGRRLRAPHRCSPFPPLIILLPPLTSC